MHKICYLFSLVQLFLKGEMFLKSLFSQGRRYMEESVTVIRLRKSHNSRLFVSWCNVPHCLIWHSADTQLFGFVTFYGPSAPVPPIVPEFSIFGMKLVSLNLCVQVTVCYSQRATNCLISEVISAFSLLFSAFWLTVADKIVQLLSSTKHSSSQPLNVILYPVCYCHVALAVL